MQARLRRAPVAAQRATAYLIFFICLNFSDIEIAQLGSSHEAQLSSGQRSSTERPRLTQPFGCDICKKAVRTTEIVALP